MKIMATGVALVCAGALAMVLLAGGKKVYRPGTPVGMLEKSIPESSGIIASRRHAGVFWTHNDQNNAPMLFAVTREGKTLGEFRVDARNDDWEDIAIDNEGRLYIANTGNNDGRRSVVEVLRLEEPHPRKGAEGGMLKVERRWQLKFPGEPFDCESLFIYQGHGYVISKVFKRRAAVMYRFALEAGTEPVTLEEVATLSIHWPVTGADIAADGSRLAVVHSKGLEVFEIGGDPAKAGSVSATWHVDFTPQNNIEGCCFVPGGVLATAESREVYFWGEEVVGKREMRNDE